MSDRSSIEWTDATWNPVRGCTKISPGCAHCYAETFAERFRGVQGHAYEHGFDLRLAPGKLSEPLNWASRRTVFVNSMSDLLHDLVPEDYVQAVVEVMRVTPWHTYQVLTKRANRLRHLLSGPLRDAATLPNVWWGVSVENRKYGIPRVRELQVTPVRLRFLSVEPLLESIEELPLAGIHWVIVGGESGPGAQPMRKAWALSLRDQCAAAGVPFFFKQWGGVNKKRNGRELDGHLHDAMPRRAEVRVPTAVDRARLRATVERLAESFSPDRIRQPVHGATGRAGVGPCLTIASSINCEIGHSGSTVSWIAT